MDTDVSCRSISSTTPTLKRRDGASAMLQRYSRPKPRSKGGSKKIVRRPGKPRDKAKTARLVEEGRKKAMEQLAAITPEEGAE